MGKEPTYTFFRRRPRNGQPQHEKVLNITSRMQTKTTMSYHYTPVKPATMSHGNNSKHHKGWKTLDHSHSTGGGACKMVQPL